LPAKRLVFEDLSSASAGNNGDAAKDEKIKALNAEVADLKGRVLTALADVENMRARMKKSAEEDKKFAVRSFAKGMLEVADCLEKALEAVPEEKRAGNADLQSVFEGVELIDKVRAQRISCS
jgi:molecular chaperone GrpE